MKVKSQDRAQPAMEESVPVNLGTENEVKEVKMGATLTPEKMEQFLALLKEYIDVMCLHGLTMICLR